MPGKPETELPFVVELGQSSGTSWKVWAAFKNLFAATEFIKSRTLENPNGAWLRVRRESKILYTASNGTMKKVHDMHAQGVWEYMADGEWPCGLMVNGRRVFIINGNSCTRAVNTLIRRGLIDHFVTMRDEIAMSLSEKGQIEMNRFKAMRALAAERRAENEKAMR